MSQAKPQSNGGVKTGTALIFAAAASLSVATIYSAQPLLDTMALDLRIAPSAIGLVITLAQIGYALGLIFIVPLGDLMDRRRLLILQGVLATLALMIVATAGSEVRLLIGMMATGILAVSVQILVAYAAALARPAERGRMVGIVTSGVVVGILGARFIAGLLADLGGWRLVYWSLAGAIAAMVGSLAVILPRGSAPHSKDDYANALRSMPRLFLRDRVLLVRGLLALSIFATFSTFWSALVLPLSAAPFLYAHSKIGLFGLVGMGGAIAAASAGRLADNGHGQIVTGASLLLLLGSWGLIGQLHRSIPLLVAGVLLLDLAVQAVHVTSQAMLVARYPEIGSRLIAGYMVFYSVGSALGAISSTMMYAHAGWFGVALLGAGYSAAGLILWSVTVTQLSSHTPPLATEYR